MSRMRDMFFCLAVTMAFTINLAAAEDESFWPKKIERGGATVVLYTPQIESLSSNRMESRSAVSVVTEEYTTPVFGAMWFDCKISTDRDERTVKLIEMKVSAAKFPDIEEEDIQKLSAFLEKEIPRWEIEMSLDQLLAGLDLTETSLELSENLNNAPPEIIFTTTPSALILIDGDPVFKEIEKTNYEYVVNTPFFIVKDTKKEIYYVNGGGNWYISRDAANTWQHTTKVPSKLEKIAEEAMGEADPEAEAAEAEGDPEAEDVIPEIILRTKPAELFQSDGEPEFSPIEGTSILYMTNTADDILMNIETQEYFILVSGRWYRSKSLTGGPWEFVSPDKVPEEFSKIPAGSDMGSVRSSIAGTQEAKEAVLENQIPQTAEVDRSEAKLEVSYDGDPKFETIGKTGMKYAVNTDKSVLLIDYRYYCCDNAIWFESERPTGPWVVSTSVPDEVQDIPPESPVYNVKYVHIYDSTPSVVYVGYTPGYVHSYAYGGCVYYGTGYWYRPWYHYHYYPRPVTYGYSVHWNPYTGWGFSFGVSYGWMTFGWRPPYYGWWGPAGYRHGYHYGYRSGYSHGYRAGYYAGARHAQNRPTPYSARAASNNIYNNRPQGVRRTGNNTYDPRTGNRVSSNDRSARPTAQPANRADNMYTDRNGNVYQRDGDNWNRVENDRQQGQSREARPSQPTTRPSQPSQQPSTRPSQPSQQPSTRPSQPSQQPSARPSQPSTRPSQPSTRPSQPST
ncbi:MAG: hypothetical protein ABFS28_08010, partial [Bacteroidota bacterium]